MLNLLLFEMGESKKDKKWVCNFLFVSWKNLKEKEKNKSGIEKERVIASKILKNVYLI